MFVSETTRGFRIRGTAKWVRSKMVADSTLVDAPPNAWVSNGVLPCKHCCTWIEAVRRAADRTGRITVRETALADWLHGTMKTVSEEFVVQNEEAAPEEAESEEAESELSITVDSSLMCYTINETAEILALSPSTIRRLIREGVIKAIRIGGGHPRVRRGEIERLVNA